MVAACVAIVAASAQSSDNQEVSSTLGVHTHFFFLVSEQVRRRQGLYDVWIILS